MKEAERGMRMAQWAVSPGNLLLPRSTHGGRDKGMNVHREREGSCYIHASFN